MKIPTLIIFALLSSGCRSLTALHSSPERTAVCDASGIPTRTDRGAKTLHAHSDDTNPVVKPPSGDKQVVVNPDGTHSTILSSGDDGKIIVNPDGTHTVVMPPSGGTQVVVNPDGTHSIIIGTGW